MHLFCSYFTTEKPVTSRTHEYGGIFSAPSFYDTTKAQSTLFN